MMSHAEAESIAYNLYHDCRSISLRSACPYTSKFFEQQRDVYAGLIRPGMRGEEAAKFFAANPGMATLPVPPWVTRTLESQSSPAS